MSSLRVKRAHIDQRVGSSFSTATSDYMHSDCWERLDRAKYDWNLCLYLGSELLRSSDEMDMLFHLHASSSQRLSDPPHGGSGKSAVKGRIYMKKRGRSDISASQHRDSTLVQLSFERPLFSPIPPRPHLSLPSVKWFRWRPQGKNQFYHNTKKPYQQSKLNNLQMLDFNRRNQGPVGKGVSGSLDRHHQRIDIPIPFQNVILEEALPTFY